MRHRALSFALAALLFSLPAAAQFYSEGNDPAGVRWWQINTTDYRVIYPEGLDSLARIYADLLERVKYPVGATAGYYPNQMYKRRHPVVLHPWTANANGMVIWTPRRMELFTTPNFSAPLPSPWEEHLVVHESRHVSQMQVGNAPAYKPYGAVLGQLFAGAVTSIYGESAFFEGDAVAAETELTASGRGRNAAFLEFWRASFREGDYRNYWQWRYGSLNKYTPNYYTAGYVRAAGMRSVYGAQDFTAQYYSRIFRKKLWPWPLFNYQKTVKEVSGKKFNAAFAEITDTLSIRWLRDEAARGPYLPSEQLTPDRRRYTDYSSLRFMDGALYAVRGGITKAPELVRITDDGTVRRLSSFAYSTSALKPSADRLYWSEVVPDPRWELRSFSEIWYAGADGRHHRLKSHTRWYNPSVSADGTRLAVTEYPFSGGSAIVVIDSRTGDEIVRFAAPDGIQAVETAWKGDRIYASGISSRGSAIYDVTSGFREVVSCGFTAVKDLFVREQHLYFTSDLDGTDELYRLSEDGAYRITNLPLGAMYYEFGKDGSLLYSELSSAGRYVKRALALPDPQKADFGIEHRYPLARDLEAPYPIPGDSVIVRGEPVRYSRLANAFRFHSWAPVYVDYDAVDDLSFNTLTSALGLGATAFFHNDLSTLQGSVAYNAAYGSHWSHTGEVKLMYSGLYPKFEATVSVSSDPASLYFMRLSYANFSRRLELTGESMEGVPSVNASLLLYVPLNFSSGGWYRGVVPQVRATVSNSLITHGRLVPMNRVSASLRGYIIQATPSSCIYPRWGFGAEAGWVGRAGAGEILTPNAYLYMYGYVPGFLETHGIRITATSDVPVGDSYFAERALSMLPRGVSSSSLASSLAGSPFQGKVTLDYAFPFLPLDWSWACPVTYFRNMEATIHADASYFALADRPFYASAGASLCFVLGNFLWIPGDTRLGVQVFYNWGVPEGVRRYDVGMVFNIDF